MQIDAAREQMVKQQVRAWGVLDQRVLDTLRQIPRERFVPAHYRELAYADACIPLAHGQHMLAPEVAGRILQALQLTPADRVLEIGTGSGFLSACMASLAGEVRSLEIHADLADSAGATLASCGIHNVRVMARDGFEAVAEIGPESYDAIVLTGSLPVYDARFAPHLARGGRLFCVVGDAPIMEARLVRRRAANEWATESLFETRLAPLIGAIPTPRFRF